MDTTKVAPTVSNSEPAPVYPAPSEASAAEQIERNLIAAIARLTALMTTADDDAIADLVSERKAMRTELRELQLASMANVVAITRGGKSQG